MLQSYPATTALILVPAARCTRTGVWCTVVELMPSWPWALLPQASTLCPVVRASACSPPPAMAVTFTPAGRWTRTGLFRCWAVPSPRRPLPLNPQASAVCFDVTAYEDKDPAATAEIFVCRD